MYSVINKERGDTIVEVLVALVVIASVLAGAFLLTRTSVRNVRDSEEHAQALNILQGQLEQLRAYAPNASSADATTIRNSSRFCFNTGGSLATGASCNDMGSNSLYDITIDRTRTVSTGTEEFLGTASWDKLGGGQSRVQLVYRIVM